MNITKKRSIPPAEWFDVDDLDAIKVEHASGRTLYDILEEDCTMEQPEEFCNVAEALDWLKSKIAEPTSISLEMYDEDPNAY